MRKLLIFGIILPILGGCAKDIYEKSGATEAEFNMDQGNCQMFALGMPQQQAPYIAPTYTATTTANGMYGGGMYSGAATTTVQPDNTGQAFANLGAALGNVARQRAAMHACMASRGYSLKQ